MAPRLVLVIIIVAFVAGLAVASFAEFREFIPGLLVQEVLAGKTAPAGQQNY